MAFVGLYPPDTVGMSRAANELGLNTKMFGGGMVGLQATSIKTQLGPLLNGVVNYGF
jgi:branched-chain amino acid transport system substrate-binding protein